MLAGLAATPAAADTLEADYTVSAFGLHLLDVETRSSVSGAGYAIDAHSHTVGLLGVLARSDVASAAHGRILDGTVRPAGFESAGHSRGADRALRINYPDGDPVVTLMRPPEPDRDPVPPAEARGAIDTLGAIVALSVRVSRTGRCDGTALVFDGRRLSRLSVRGAGTERVSAAGPGGYAGPALRCDFESRQLGGFLHDDTRGRLMKPLHGTAWLASPRPGAAIAAVRAVFESSLFGTATLELTNAHRSP